MPHSDPPTRALWKALLFCALPFSAAATQTANETAAGRVARGVPTDAPTTIDGRLDDEVWPAAPVISNFVQHEPFEGRPATERTEIRILYDETAIYVGAWMFDCSAGGILTGENRRDADALLLVLDTFLDRQNAYLFGTTPVGIEYDGQVTKDGEGGLTTTRRVQTGAGSGGNVLPRRCRMNQIFHMARLIDVPK